MAFSSRNPRQTWLIRFLGWDGLVPAVIWLLPLTIGLLIPQLPQLIEALAVLLPLIAFFLRLRAGASHIGANQCGPVVRYGQYLVLCLAIVLLAVIDAFVILANLMPKGSFTTEDIVIFVCMYCIYLLCMLIALYPGGVGVDEQQGQFGECRLQ